MGPGPFSWEVPAELLHGHTRKNVAYHVMLLSRNCLEFAGMNRKIICDL